MLNFKRGGIPIARVKGGKKNGKKIYLHEENNERFNIFDPIDIDELGKFNICPYCETHFTRYDNARRHLQNSCNIKKLIEAYGIQNNLVTSREIKVDGQLIPLPIKAYRENLYICGPAGSGKSYYARQYMDEFIKLFPDKDVIYFSCIPNDENFENGRILKIAISDDMLEDPIELKRELSNSLIIFDDIFSSTNNALVKYMLKLRDDVLLNGRDQSNNGQDIYSVSTSHLLTDYRQTRVMLLECTSITIFPRSGISAQITQALNKYFGLSKKQIERILKIRSRWVTLYRRYPMFVLYENGAYLL